LGVAIRYLILGFSSYNPTGYGKILKTSNDTHDSLSGSPQPGSFAQFLLKEQLQRAAAELGFTVPTEIQKKVIPRILQDTRDIIALAQTGTGKTASFGFPILEKTPAAAKSVFGLILCPTRELCIQSAGEIEKYAKYLNHVKIVPVYGGAAIQPQIDLLSRGAQIIIATPGRILDFIRRSAADISRIAYLVLDEADSMLNLGFKEELDAILAAAPAERTTILISATMSAEVRRIAEKYMRNPLEIIAGVKNTGTALINHFFCAVQAKDKYPVLRRIIDANPELYGIIFCRTRLGTQDVADRMMKDGYSIESLHGDLSQAARELVMKKFRNKTVRLLAATDVAARGLDVHDLTHIINYDLPEEIELYNHRTGRTGRAGKTGVSFSIITGRERKRLDIIRRAIKRDIIETDAPSGTTVCAHRILHTAEKIKNISVQEDDIASFLPAVEETLAEYSREELIKRFISLECGEYLNNYLNAGDIISVKNPVYSEKYTSEHNRQKKGLRDNTQFRKIRHSSKDDTNAYKERDKNFVWITVNVGKKQGMLPPVIINLIRKSVPAAGHRIKIGKIILHTAKTELQIEKNSAAEVLTGLRKQIFGKTVISADMTKKV